MNIIKRVTAKDIYEMTHTLDEQMEKRIDKWLLTKVGDFAIGDGEVRVYADEAGLSDENLPRMSLKVLQKSLESRGFAVGIFEDGRRLGEPFLIASIPPQGR